MSKDKEELQEEAVERIIREITEDEKCKAYFEPYEDDDVTTFIRSFAESKARLEVYGDFIKYQQENIIADYHERAWYALKEIQLKKLFDLECKWRAEEVRDVPDVLVTKDFDRIAENILLYDGISPVSERDIQFYQQFLNRKQTSVFYRINVRFYYDYELMRDRFLKEPEADEIYFDFHRKYTSSKDLLNLPDIRSKKEEKYLDALREYNSSKSTSEETPKPPSQPTNQKQYLSSRDVELIKFGEYMGDKRTTNFLKDRQNWIMEKPDLIFHWAYEYLGDIAPEKVAVEANDDWKKGLYFAAIQHKNRKVSELLPSIHEEYLMKRQMGLLASEEELAPNVDICDYLRKHILDGREILGEPRDFNY